MLTYPAVLSEGDVGPKRTGRVYLGSSKNSSTHRRQNGVSSDFVNPLKWIATEVFFLSIPQLDFNKEHGKLNIKEQECGDLGHTKEDTEVIESKP